MVDRVEPCPLPMHLTVCLLLLAASVGIGTSEYAVLMRCYRRFGSFSRSGRQMTAAGRDHGATVRG
jgi:hypothetical protein